MLFRSHHAHEALKRLKMGDVGTVAVTKEFPVDELTRYVHAYARHKNKWFDTRYDATSKLIYATRVTPPPWDKPEEIDDEEEE